MRRLKSWILLGTALAAAGCAEAGSIKGKSMEDQLEQLASAYRDLYAAPVEARTKELDFKIADLEWEGLYLAASATVDAATTGIPLLAFMKRDDLLEWEVPLRKNSVIVFTDLERGTTGMKQLYAP